jgi:hypothetical protein
MLMVKHVIHFFLASMPQDVNHKEQAEEELMKLFDVTEKDFSCYMPIDMVKQLMQSGKGSSSAREILRCILQAK